MKYSVLVTNTTVACQSIVVEADDEAAAIEAGTKRVRHGAGIDLEEVSSVWQGEVTKVIVSAGPPVAAPAVAHPTVQMKRVEHEAPLCSCRPGRNEYEPDETDPNCPVHGL